MKAQGPWISKIRDSSRSLRRVSSSSEAAAAPPCESFAPALDGGEGEVQERPLSLLEDEGHLALLLAGRLPRLLVAGRSGTRCRLRVLVAWGRGGRGEEGEDRDQEGETASAHGISSGSLSARSG